jgi:hypothetical protein
MDNAAMTKHLTAAWPEILEFAERYHLDVIELLLMVKRAFVDYEYEIIQKEIETTVADLGEVGAEAEAMASVLSEVIHNGPMHDIVFGESAKPSPFLTRRDTKYFERCSEQEQQARLEYLQNIEIAKEYWNSVPAGTEMTAREIFDLLGLPYPRRAKLLTNWLFDVAPNTVYAGLREKRRALFRKVASDRVGERA